MEVYLTPEQEAFVNSGIQSGRFRTAEEAVQVALDGWVERERRRAELLLLLDDAEASAAAGRGKPISAESMQQVADGVKRRGRQRLRQAAG